MYLVFGVGGFGIVHIVFGRVYLVFWIVYLDFIKDGTRQMLLIVISFDDLGGYDKKVSDPLASSLCQNICMTS